ncbi:hypothetical protein ACHAXT_006651 [Thalassiosira profunda]
MPSSPGRPGRRPPPPPPNKSSPRTPPPHQSPRTPPRKRSPDDGASSSAMLSTPPPPPYGPTAQNSSPSTTQMVANPPADGRINPQWQAYSTVGASPSLWQMQNSPGAIPRSPSLRENSRGSPSAANQIVAASPADSRINPQYQIHGSPVSPGYSRKNPPPPPPPRRTNSSQQLVAASRELHRSQSFTRKESGGSPSMLDGSGRSGASSKGRARSGSLSGSLRSDSRGSRGSLRRERSNSLSSSERAGIQVHPSGDEFEENVALSNSSRKLLAGLSRDHQKGAAMLRASGEREALRADSEDEDEEEPPKHLCDRICSAMMCVFPKVEPLPWGQFAILTLWCGIPPACYVLLFTQMGAGEQIYYRIAIELGEHASALAAGLAAYIVALYMLDADQWASRCGSIARDLSILAVIVGTVILVLMIADRYPYGMICLFAIFQPLWLLAAWALWVFSDPDNEWNKVARTTAAERTGCVPDFESYPECRKEEGSDETCFYVDKHDNTEELVFPEGCDQSCTRVYDGCLNGFIVWVGPVLVGLVLFFLSTFSTFLRSGESYYATLKRRKLLYLYGSIDTSKPLLLHYSHRPSTVAEGAREKDVLNFGAVWIFILFALWVTTSLSGVAAGVTSALAALTLASFVASAMFLAVSFSKEERNKNAAAVFDRMREKYGKNLDVARGLFVVTCAPIVLVYFGFSIANQFIRKSSIFSCSQPPGERGDIFTTRTRKQVEMIKKWDRAKVYTIAVYWGIAFMVLQVLVANLTVVFLSWMIEKMSGFGLAAVTAIMAGVGILMFLLPPVPGVPVYLSLGIVLPAQGHELLGWAGSIAYSCAVGLCLKLFACALQQKMIGENLSHYVKVRQFVGINSTLIKAMRLVLGKSGFSVPKVAILIGGPDWPTSVLCGIMRLSLLQILLGTTPIVALIAPTCLTGALLYMASLETDTGNPQFPWAGTVSTISASLTAIVQFGSMLIAAYYLEQTANKRAAEVEAIPIDSEVKDADDKAAHLRQCYRDVTQWEVIPTSAKLLIQTSLACIVTSSYLVQLFGSLCFTEHSLTDSIDENLDGKVSNLFLPLGWVSVGLFCLSMLLIYLFESWGEKKAYDLATGVSVSPTALDDSSTAAVPERRLSRSAHSVTRKTPPVEEESRPGEPSPSLEKEEPKQAGKSFASRLGMGKQRSGVQEEDAGLEMKEGSGSERGKPQPEVKQSASESSAGNASADGDNSASKARRLKNMASSLVPKFEPLPWSTFLLLALWCAIPAATYILLFTQMGFGEMFYYSLSHRFGGSAYIFAGVLAIFGFFYYVLDIGEWTSAVGSVFRFLSRALMLALFVCLVVLSSNAFSYGIITMFAVLNPVWLLHVVRKVFYRGKDARTFTVWLSGPLLWVSLLTFGAFIVWICLDSDNQWNSVTRVQAAENSGCEANFDAYPNCMNEDGSGTTCFYVDSSSGQETLVFPDNCDHQCVNVYGECSNGFILWVGPVLLALSLLFLSFLCTFFRVETNEQHMMTFGKLWFFVLFIMWASASLSGAAAGLTNTLLSLTLANFVGASVVFVTVLDNEEREKNQRDVMQRIHEKYGDGNMNIVRGLFIVTCSPILILYFGLSAINQLVRRIGVNPCSQPTCEESDTAGIVTVRAKKQLTTMRSWNRAKVMTIGVYWGIAFMVLQVLVANLTVVFLSWLIEKTASLGLAAVTAIVAGVGVLMFLLPPVPGVPVYLTLGIVLTARGNELLGWVGAIFYSTGIGLVLKLFSSALQQKMIGEKLSHYVSVRQFVGINSTLMKSMRLVLGQNGISVPKVAILIGGPDWPTSVLCGIMRLSLPQIMLGTVPIVFLILPTCLTGALLYMASLELDNGNPLFPWAGTVSTLTASLTAMVQFGSMLIAAYYLELAADKHPEEVQAIEEDKEVKEADEKDTHMTKCYETVTEWNSGLPLLAKLVLCCSLACITASCYMVQFFGELCFVEHSLTDSYYENLAGNAFNIFLPLGWAAVALFAASIVLLYTFSSWGKKQAKKLAESERAVPLSSSDIA